MKIAVIGSGIAGLGAAWLLRRQAAVTVYERAARIGGHSHTVIVDEKEGGGPVAVDTGFIVYNMATYPNLIALFRQLDVPTAASDMSFGVSLDGGAVEYSGDNLSTLIGHWQNIVRPAHWRMIGDLVRFYRTASKLYAAPPQQTLGAFLDLHGYGAAFRDDHLLPMAAAIWSTPPAEIMRFPAQSLGHFFRNHGLLELNAKRRPPWRTVVGGSKAYVDRLVQDSRARVVTGAAITAVRGGKDSATLAFADGSAESFDHVILAAHADESLALLPDATPAQRAILGCFRYRGNQTYLHQDQALMPRRRRLWASWNYLRPKDAAGNEVFVTYWMNRLQSLVSSRPFLVSLNPPSPPAADKTFARMIYHHPQFDEAALAAQRRLRFVQGRDRLWFCGSYCGYGFHEDALASGLAVAQALGVARPWDAADVSPAFANASPAHE